MPGILSKAIFILIFISTFYASAQVRVVKAAKNNNPRVLFLGVTGDTAMSKAVSSNLQRCGWFEMVSGENADYRIGGSSSGNQLRLDVFSGNGQPIKSFRVTGESGSWAANHGVDAILNMLFKIPGICSSRICFSAELQAGVKEIYVADFDGSNVRRLTRNGRLSVEADWIPGTSRLVYTRYGRSTTDIIEYDLPSRRSRQLIQFKGLNAGAAVSPQGEHLAVILSKDGRVDLYLKGIQQRQTFRLTNSEAAEASPCWSPRGDRICFVSGVRGNPSLYTIPARGGQMSRVPVTGLETVSPDWSRNNQIVYAARMGRNYTIGVTDLEGREQPRNLISAAGDWESPSWAPDGRHIVCSRTINGKSSLYIIDSWTGKARQFLGGKHNLSLPSWSDIQK